MSRHSQESVNFFGVKMSLDDLKGPIRGSVEAGLPLSEALATAYDGMATRFLGPDHTHPFTDDAFHLLLSAIPEVEADQGNKMTEPNSGETAGLSDWWWRTRLEKRSLLLSEGHGRAAAESIVEILENQLSNSEDLNSINTVRQSRLIKLVKPLTKSELTPSIWHKQEPIIRDGKAIGFSLHTTLGNFNRAIFADKAPHLGRGTMKRWRISEMLDEESKGSLSTSVMGYDGKADDEGIILQLNFIPPEGSEDMEHWRIRTLEFSCDGCPNKIKNINEEDICMAVARVAMHFGANNSELPTSIDQLPGDTVVKVGHAGELIPAAETIHTSGMSSAAQPNKYCIARESVANRVTLRSREVPVGIINMANQLHELI